jgi:glyoxylase-like metal-dependent hydrolase (beta-lactamase superfamily II)
MHSSHGLVHATVVRVSASETGRIAVFWLVLMTALLHGACAVHRTATRQAPMARATSWAEVFAQPTEVTVEALVTGQASGDRRMVLDPHDPNIRHLSNPSEPSAVLAHLVHHPRHGYFLVDAGLSRTFTDGGGNYSAPLRKLLSTIGVVTRQSPGEDMASQLRARSVVPSEVFLTHLHEDHTSGLADLDCGIPALFGAGEGPPGVHFTCRSVHQIDFRDAQPMVPFDHVLDVFGDGSFWAISTPGHSPGHISYLVNASGGPVLITGDAAAYHAQLAHRIRPAPGVFDPDAAARSLDQLAELTERFPRLRVFAGHELPR